MATPDHEPTLPFNFGPVSNGEFVPRPPSPAAREAIRRAEAQAEANARRLGVSRRRFLVSLCGSATVLVALNSCSNDSSRAGGGGTPGGSFDVSPESTLDADAAVEDLAGDEFIMDVQTHFVDEIAGPAAAATAGYFVQAGESARRAGRAEVARECDIEVDDPLLCFSAETYLAELFLNSDTSLAVLSALPTPGEGNALPPQAMDNARQLSLALCPHPRVLMHGGAFPHADGSLEANLLAMTAARQDYEIAAWKVYTHTPVDAAFYLDDHDPLRPQIGQQFIDHVREIGPPIICTHKGLGQVGGGSPDLASPADIGPAAARNPDISFVVYHSGFEFEHPEGPWDPDTAHLGTNRLVTSVLDAGLEPNANVYAELGSTWWAVMSDPDKAAHVLGKLLLYIGEDRVVWGTDSVWYGTPQDQIEAFRAFRISEEYQERYGYPALTPEVKAKVLGLNSAALYGVEPDAVECTFTREELRTARQEVAIPARTYGPTNRAELAAHLRAHGALA